MASSKGCGLKPTYRPLQPRYPFVGGHIIPAMALSMGVVWNPHAAPFEPIHPLVWGDPFRSGVVDWGRREIHTSLLSNSFSSHCCYIYT